MKKRILSIVTALALTMALLPAAAVPARAAGAGRTVQVGNSDAFNNAITDLQNGDTIQLTGSFVVTTPTSSNDSLFIGKNVTIDGQGYWLSLRYAGVLLGADVTFKNVTLGLASNVRPALMANGHTLTLENVQRNPSNRNINLFCGGLTGGNQGGLSQGSHGQIIIKGNTYLGPTGRIFAGSISTDGSDNVFARPATVTIDPSVTGDPIGELYACGALETYTSENDWFNYQKEINPPFASPGNFRVSGNVTFNLYQGKVEKVSGDTGVGGNLAQVNYNGTDFLNDSLVLSSIGGLTVNGGNLAPAAGKLVQKNVNTAGRTSEIVPDSGSSFFDSNTPLTIARGATLGLQKLGSTVTVGSFTGGGSLVLGADQRLKVIGTVSGTTTVGIGSIFNGHSLTVPNTEGHTYIDAAQSSDTSFTLAAPASRPDIKLVNNGSGAWTAVADPDATIVNDFTILSAVAETDATELPCLPIQNVQFLSSGSRNQITYISLEIKVNNEKTTWDEDADAYIDNTNSLIVSVADNSYGTGEVLELSDKNYACPPAGTYVISVTVPAANSGTGQPITRTATLTVKAAGGVATTIPEPKANEGLVYNGQEQVGVPIGGAYELERGDASATNAGSYTAKVKPASGFAWSNNSTNPTDPVDIEWRIKKADNPNPLPSLGATAPTTYGGSDGKITGTTAEMEYSTDKDFTSFNTCSAPATTGLAAGNYYVRIAESTNYEAGQAVLVTVPQGPITVRTVAINSTGHKTNYTVGDLLDVTGLTLTVTMSNNSTYLVPVAAGMVSGFNSSSAVQGQTLTITYGGQTVTYSINIVADANPVTSIAITSTDHKTQYTVRELLDVTGLKLTVTRQNGPAEVIDVFANMVTGFNSESPVERQILTVAYGGQTTTYTISISENTGTDPVAVTGVTLNKSAAALTVGSSERLTATVFPGNASNKTVAWASQNTAIATVDAGGTVTAVSVGTTVITVTTEDGGKSASCTVTVSPNGGGGSSGGSGGSSGGGSSGGSSSGGSSSGGSGSSSNTTTNADGSVTTTVTDKKTGTVTTTTKKPDGSTTVVEAKKDGTVTITDTAKNGVKVEAVSKPETDTAARVTVPAGVKTATVTVPVAVTPGMVAVDARTGEVVKLSAPTEAGMIVKLDGSADLVLEDRSKAFTDTDGHWAESAIDFATAHALFGGTSDATFAPDEPMTRGMVAVVLHNFEGNPDSVAQPSFTDAASGKWYTGAIRWVTGKGIAGGYGDGSFGADDPITREQLVAFLYRYAGAMGYSTEGSADLSAFPDGANVSAYVAEAMSWAVGNGLIVGTDGGALAPGDSATRAQVAVILNRFVLNLMK